MVDVLRELDVERKGGHTAAADMAYLYAMTHVWFTVERNYKVCSLLSKVFVLLMSQPVDHVDYCYGNMYLQLSR